MIEYSVETEIRVDWSDLDLLGHVNNLAIMRYMQSARVIYFEKIGIPPDNKPVGIGPIMASVNGQFKKQIRYPGRIKVFSTITEMKITSLHMKHYIVDEQGEIAAEGLDIIVIYDFGKNVKHVIPDELRARINLLESERKIYTPEH
jgi:acyl-CoA thioester hydrolase